MGYFKVGDILEVFILLNEYYLYLENLYKYLLFKSKLWSEDILGYIINYWRG